MLISKAFMWGQCKSENDMQVIFHMLPKGYCGSFYIPTLVVQNRIKTFIVILKFYWRIHSVTKYPSARVVVKKNDIWSTFFYDFVLVHSLYYHFENFRTIGIWSHDLSESMFLKWKKNINRLMDPAPTNICNAYSPSLCSGE